MVSRQIPHLVDGIAPFRSERFINAGLVRQRSANAIDSIVGTSMVQNFRASQVGSLFNESIINLGMGGSSLTEQAAVIRAAEDRRQGAITRVFWGLDENIWAADPQAPINIEPFPLYLYQPSALPLVTNYLLSKDVLALSLSGMARRGKPIDLDELYRWARMNYNFSCETVKKTYLDGPFAGVAPEALGRNARAQVTATVEPIVRDYPNTIFYLFIPPYSSAEYLRLAKRAPGVLAALEPFAGELAKLAQRFSHVRVYDFRTRWEVVSNLNLFKDGLHYSPAINDSMAAYMAANSGLPSDGKFLPLASALTEAKRLRVRARIKGEAVTWLSDRHRMRYARKQRYPCKAAVTLPNPPRELVRRHRPLNPPRAAVLELTGNGTEQTAFVSDCCSPNVRALTTRARDQVRVAPR